MINTCKLKAKMIENSYTLATLAEKINLSKTGLFNKLHNHNEFTVSELNLIAKSLKLNSFELQSIFFNYEVEFNSTFINRSPNEKYKD